jgi:hypothetical protein
MLLVPDIATPTPELTTTELPYTPLPGRHLNKFLIQRNQNMKIYITTATNSI